MTKNLFITLTALLAVSPLPARSVYHMESDARAGGQVATIDRPETRITTNLGAIGWQSPSRIHLGLSKVQGQLRFDEQGVEFRSDKGLVLKWLFVDIQTIFISPHWLVIETYQNRRHHVPGVQRYRFDLSQAVPSGFAAELARKVQRPSQNAVPDSSSPSEVNVHAHHSTRIGGTNGALRFRDSGIDYVTSIPGDSRSWRWGDIQTLSNPDAYHLTVFGYLETYSFDLKERLEQKTYDTLNDEVYRHHEELRENPDKGTQGVAE